MVPSEDLRRCGNPISLSARSTESTSREKQQLSQMKEIPMGGFASASAQMRHYAECKGDGVVQMMALRLLC